MISTLNQIASKPGANASSMKRATKQGRSFKCCGHCGKMAPTNNKIICDGCDTAFPIKKNANSKQGRSFKRCGECDEMAGSNNQIKCKKCASANWVKRQTLKRSVKRVLKQPVVKKRKTSGKNVLDDMLALLDSTPNNEPSTTKVTPNDLFSDYEPVDEDSMFSELMTDMATAPKPLTRDSSLTIGDDIFDEFIGDMDADTSEFEHDTSWFDNFFASPSVDGSVSV